jgi:hypothetical protein
MNEYFTLRPLKIASTADVRKARAFFSKAQS